MTTQEIYERQRAWFTRPGAVFGHSISSDGSGHCVYIDRRCVYIDPGDEQVRCAVGCILSPPSLRTILDHFFSGGVEDLIDAFPEIVERENWDKETERFLGDTQRMHDEHALNVAPLGQEERAENEAALGLFIRDLDNYAVEYGLDVDRAKAFCDVSMDPEEIDQ